MTEPLRRLEDKDAEWQWLKQEEGTIQCNVSETGLGAVLMQNGQPICYASRALTDTETRYAQIEKELLAIVWSCHKFDQYIHGHDIVHVDSDREQLQAVLKKPIHQSPKRLQRMRMALQSYSLDIRYKKGSLMFIADALRGSFRLTTDDAQHDNREKRALREVHHTDGLSVSQKRLEEFKLRAAQDPEMQLLTSQIQ